jgi:hypothetical protein
MNNANHRVQVSDLLDEWTNNPKQAKNIINCLVEFLVGDLYWLNENISKVDRETLVAAAKRLEHSEAPNAELNGGCLQPSDLSAELGAGG